MRVLIGLGVAAAVLMVMMGASPQVRKAPGKKAQAPPAGGIGDLIPARPVPPPATIAGETPAVRVSDPSMTADWPAISGPWAIYVEWDGKDRDRVLARRQSAEGQWGAPIELRDGSGGTIIRLPLPRSPAVGPWPRGRPRSTVTSKYSAQ